MSNPIPLAAAAVVLALSAAACGSSSAPTSTATTSSAATATATAAPTSIASPTPAATPTPSAAAAISLTCPTASTVSTDFQTPFTLLASSGGEPLAANGGPPSGASANACTYTDSSIGADISVVLATGYPAADFSTAEQDITQDTVEGQAFDGGTITGSQTFDPHSGLGDQAVDYNFTLSTPSGTNYEFGTIAIQGTNLVSVLGYGTTFTPDQQMFNTLIEALLA